MRVHHNQLLSSSAVQDAIGWPDTVTQLMHCQRGPEDARQSQEAGSTTHATKPAITSVTSTVCVVFVRHWYCRFSHASLPWDLSSLNSATAQYVQLLWSAQCSTRLLLQAQE